MKNHRLVAALGILTILCSQVHAQSSDLSSTQIRFAQDGLTYTIDYTKIRLGFTAIRLYQGYNIGEFFFESPKVYQDYKNYVERRADDLESSLQVLRTSIGQAAAKLDAASQHLPTIAEEANLSEGAEDQSEEILQ